MRNDLLEFSSLKEYIRPFVFSDIGYSALSDLSPAGSWDEARYRLDMLGEMLGLINAGQSPVMAAISDIRPLLTIREGAVLEGQDLVKVSEALTVMAKLRNSLISSGPLLSEVASRIEPFDYISSQIDAMLLPTGEVSDDAYPFLRDLRVRYRNIRSSILEKLENLIEKLKTKSVLMDELITKRNDRFVIPLRHDYNQHLKGITHDYSRTNHTVYVEPLSVVDENNSLNQIKSQIQEEEHKVLRDLTGLVYEHTSEIRENLNIYGRLDLILACSKWSVHIDAHIPRILDEEINIMAARHPILIERLGKTATIPLDLRISKGKDCLIITGPNAGGKTVALKTIGLLILMAKAGLAIPAHADSIITPIAEVLVEMDTNQDITHDLSSFTAHAMSLKAIYDHASSGDLVLLDEPGTGTDPEQGGALAVAIIDALRLKGAKVVVTSHSDLVKLYGMTAQGVENAATAFDDTGLKPMYALQYGVVGQSRAFDILEAIKFPHELITQAREIADRTGNSPLAKAILDISKASAMRQEAEKDLEEARRLEALARQEFNAGKKERAESALRYKRLMDNLEVLSRRQIRQEALNAIREMPEAKELVQVLSETSPSQALNIRKGCIVRLRGGEQEGEVADVSQESAEVIFAGKRARIALDQLEIIMQPEESRRKKETVSLMSALPPVLPIKIVGMRVDEAIPLVERAIDRAMLTGQDNLEIIHGAGTGRLRKAIREYLVGLPCVKKMQDAPMSEGGSNKTVVELGVK